MRRTTKFSFGSLGKRSPFTLFRYSLRGCKGRGFILSRLFVWLSVAFLICWCGFGASALEPLRPVQVYVGDQPFRGSQSPLTDGSETFVPLDFLSLLGAQGQLSRRGDTVRIRYRHPVQEAEVAVARPNGVCMLPLSDLARLFSATVLPTSSQNSAQQVANWDHNDRVYFLAGVTDIRLQQNAIRFTTSFPVPYQVHMLEEDGQRVAYVDCLGAHVDSNILDRPLPSDNPYINNLRVGQFQPFVVRVAVNIPPSMRVRQGKGQADPEGQVIVVLWPDPKGLARMARKNKGNSQSAQASTVQTPNALGENVTSPAEGQPGNMAEEQASNSSQTASENPGASSPPSIPSQLPNSFVQIQRIVFEPEDDRSATLRIYTSGPLQPSITYTPDGGLQLDLPKAMLGLADPDKAEQSLNHPLLTHLQAIALDQNPPAVRIVLQTPRYDGFVLDPRLDQVVVRLRLPRNATGVLADKLIVVDPGHGGSATGATAGGYAEKNITLTIALKLRRVLEACGARVVLTRDRDRDVDLSARPALANSIHADLFVSIHNDACSHPGEASGTTTYYHMDDPSSRALANCVQQAVAAVSGLPNRGARSDSMLYQHGLAVLRESKMPAILIEVAYLDNPIDRRKLIDPSFQERVAEALCRGLRVYVEGHPQTALLPFADLSP